MYMSDMVTEERRKEINERLTTLGSLLVYPSHYTKEEVKEMEREMDALKEELEG